MHNLTNDSIIINRPISDVFSYVTNMENYKEWFPGVIDIRSENSTPHGTLGKRYHEMIKIPFRAIERITVEVVESKKNCLFITEATIEGLLPRMSIEFVATKDGSTKVTRRMDSRSNSPFIKLIIFIMKDDARRKSRKGMERLKQILESK